MYNYQKEKAIIVGNADARALEDLARVYRAAARILNERKVLIKGELLSEVKHLGVNWQQMAIVDWAVSIGGWRVIDDGRWWQNQIVESR